MPSNKETLFQDHICSFLENEHEYITLSNDELQDKDNHFIKSKLIEFIQKTQSEKYEKLQENYSTDADEEILKALRADALKKPLWLLMRDGLDVHGIKFELYKTKPRNPENEADLELYHENIFTFKKEYYYKKHSQERVDLVIWLNGLPIIVIELKHEDEGQICEDAIVDFFGRDLTNHLYRHPFLYIAMSNTEVKVSTNPTDVNNFRWFNAQLVNKAETDGEYPVEHVYRHTLSKENIAAYLEHFLVFVPAKEEIIEGGEVITKPSFTIFPRFHQFRASKALSGLVQTQIDENKELGQKYLVEHSAGSGKTLTIAWMADLLDSLYTVNNQKVFDNIIILTDRKSLDKNVKDDLGKFTHLGHKINFAKRSRHLAEYLENDRDIIVTTIQKFNYIQEKLSSNDILKNRKVAFLIDEAHRSQSGILAHTMREYFTTEDVVQECLEDVDISNQVFVAFTATATQKTIDYFGEPIDIYSEEEAIQEGYILDVSQNILSYETLYNLKINEAISDKDYPAGILEMMLKRKAFNDEGLIQYKAEVMVDLFEKNVADTIGKKGKAMVVASSQLAGYRYYQNIKTIFTEKNLPYKVLFAFSGFQHPDTEKLIEEEKLNQLDTLYRGLTIEEVFDMAEYRIMVVANKFQTGFDQPLLSAMFLDKEINGINAVQTISRLNRNHNEKNQEDITVVDFTNNSKNIFDAFNNYRKGAPYKEREPNKEVIIELYDEIIGKDIFSINEIETYVYEYLIAEEEAKKRNSTPDAILSNLNQEYRTRFKKQVKTIDEQKVYISLLSRYVKLFYFITRFFTVPSELTQFVIFAEVMSIILIKKGKTSELTEILKKIKLSKGAVLFEGIKINRRIAKKVSSGSKVSTGGGTQPRSTITEALDKIKDKYNISDEDAIVIREVCEDVSQKEDIHDNVINNKKDELFLESYEPSIQGEVKEEYKERDLWSQLANDIYIEPGGIFTLMGKTVIKMIISKERSPE